MPMAGEAHIDRYLTNYSRRISNEGFIAEQCCTVVPVQKDSDRYGTYDNAHLRAVNDERAPGSPPNAVDYGIGSERYALVEHTLRDAVPDEERKNADAPFAPYEDAAAGIKERIEIRKEKKVAGVFFNTTGWANKDTLSGTDQWSDPDSDPFQPIADGKSSVLSKSLRKANLMIMGQEVFEKLSVHPAIIERIKYTSRDSVTPEMLARLFDIAELRIGSAVENVANEGAADDLRYIWGKHCFIGYKSPRASTKTVTAVSLFRNRLFPLARRYGHPDPGAKSTWVEYGDKFDQRQVADGAGFLLINAVG